MTVYEEKEVTVTKQVPSKVICDRCGITKEPYEEFIEVKHEYGYSSPKDGDYIEFDICESCMEDVIRDMKIKARFYQNDISEF